MKILFPQGEASDAEVEEILRTAIEGRKRVKDQLLRIDPTYPPVCFSYQGLAAGQEHRVRTLEEEEYPRAYHQSLDGGEGRGDKSGSAPGTETVTEPGAVTGDTSAADSSALAEGGPTPTDVNRT